MPDRESYVFLDAQADAHFSSRDTLISGIGTFRSIIDDPDADPFETYNASERLRAFETELARRDTVGQLSSGQGNRFDDQHQAWADLAEAVKERCEVPDILTLAGIPMRRTGRTRGSDEWHGPCPACGEGEDRLIAWSGPNGRFWCRRCMWSGDVIAAASLIVGPGFRDRVRFLANRAELECPEQSVLQRPRNGRHEPFEYRGGKVVTP